ncbi:hypothetical protein [Gordonia terrae]|uniref:hypothetical protein n=1 Tax=Gordonia terrae TaxID=2055 RepID=UPI0003A3B41F|nr:hypothetical protein [Gordonia terrae]
MLGAAGWSTTGLTDFCPDCVDIDPAPTAGTRPHLTIVRDQPPAWADRDPTAGTPTPTD